MTNQAKAKLLRSAASALEHGRYATARKKVLAVLPAYSRYEQFIMGIVTALEDDIENDEPINGSDAVDWLCELYRDAKKALKED